MERLNGSYEISQRTGSLWHGLCCGIRSVTGVHSGNA